MTEERRIPTVVIAEHNTAQRALLEMSLMGEYQVVALSDGAKVLQYARAHTPDAFVFDLDMPYLDGLSVCHRLKRISRFKRVPMIIMSAQNVTDLQSTVRWVKADALIQKPFRHQDLRSIVRRLLTEKHRDLLVIKNLEVLSATLNEEGVYADQGHLGRDERQR